MKIRSITCFHAADPADAAASARPVAALLGSARSALTQAGWDVQTTRWALPPLAQLPGLAGRQPGALVTLARSLEEIAQRLNIEFVTLGPAPLDAPEEVWAAISPALAATTRVFAAGEIAHPEQGLSPRAAQFAARVIHQNASATADGFVNLRFAALANVPPGVPFLPAAYHDGGRPRFALATEAADLAVSAFAQARSLAEARARLIEALESQAAALAAVCAEVARTTGVEFGGIDLSLAPYPEHARSIGVALESLGLSALGLPGSVAAVAFLTDALQSARLPRTGFTGLFLPVLEDRVLAERSGEGALQLSELLLYSAVCGTGLDTVPLPGAVTVEQLTAVLLDVGALALRLGKPLTARLMPLPGKRAGDPVEFAFDYFAPGRVLDCKARPLVGLLAQPDSIPLARYMR